MRSLVAVLLVGTLTLAPVRAGEVKETYPDGKPKLTYRTDAAGKKQGAETFYSPKGKVRAVVNYANGERTGSVTLYDDAGKRRVLQFPRTVSAIERAWSELYPYESLPAEFDVEPLLTPPYRAGTLKKEIIDQSLNFVRLYRQLSGLSTNITENKQFSQRAAAASVVLQKIGSLTHTPAKPDDMPEPFFKIAADGCAHSNIFHAPGGRMKVAETIRGYMDDSDPGNSSKVGHRQWLLNPTMNAIGFGAAGDFSATWAHGSTGGAPSIRSVTFPSEGFYPCELIGANYVWSFHFNAQLFEIPDRSAVKVRVEQLDDAWEKTADIPTNVVSIFTEAGWPMPVLIFKPDIKQITPARYLVEITGLKPRLGDPTVSYIVEFISMKDVKQSKPEAKPKTTAAPATKPADAIR